MEYVIRPYADPADRAELLALYRVTWHAAYDAIDGAETIDRLIETLLADDGAEMFALPPGDIALVAVGENRIVGGARAHPRTDAVHLSGLYVLPEAQRAGVGAALLSMLMARFPRGSEWRTDVRPQSPEALAFYGQAGFVEIGRGRADVGGGYLVETIELSRRPPSDAMNELWLRHHARHAQQGAD